MKSVLQSLVLLGSFALACVVGRAQEQPPDLDTVLKAAETYESGQSLEPFRQLEQRMKEAVGQPILQQQLEEGLIRLLGTNATFEARKFACKELGILGSRAALPALQDMLQSEETAGIACLALTTYPPGNADELLRRALEYAHGLARVQILNTLGDRHDTKAVPLLVRQAHDPDSMVAEAAISALGKLASRDVAKTLLQLSAAEQRPELKPVLSEAVLRCADALLAAGDRKRAAFAYEELLRTADQPAIRRSAFSALVGLDKDGGEDRVFEALSGTDAVLKPVAVQKITALKGSRISDKLADVMPLLSIELQAQLVGVLAARADDSARLVVAKSLSSSEPALRHAAIQGLAEMRDPYFVSLLARAAASGDAEEGKAVENALVGLDGGAETDHRLEAQLKNALPKARVVLIGAISRRHAAGANALFLEDADNLDPAVAKTALRALAKTGGEAETGPLLKKLAAIPDAGIRNEAQSTASQLLRRIQPTEKRSELVKHALESAAADDNRCALLELLPACGDAAALALAKSSLTNDEAAVHEAAVRALAEWPDESAWDTLLEVYHRDESPAAKGIALRGLVQMLREQNEHPNRQLMMRYNELLRSATSVADVKLLLGAVSGVADPEALGLVIPFLSNTEVHGEAAAAAEQIVANVKAQHPELADEALKRLQQK